MINRFTELKDNAYQSSQVIGAQLQSVESSLLGALISILISAFISERFGLLMFWLPASFLLMWVVLMNSFFRSVIPLLRRLLPIIPFKLLLPLVWSLVLSILWMLIRRLLSSIPLLRRLLGSSRTEQNGNVQIGGLLTEADKFSITTGFKNVTPFFKSIGVIFLVSFLSLLLYKSAKIGEDITFSIWIPLISSLLFISLPILNNRAITALEKSRSVLDFTNLSDLAWFSIAFRAVVYVLALLALPIWSFVILRPIYIGWSPSILHILVVMVLQAVAALAFINYFSANLVRKEMNIALFHLSTIQNRIEDLLSDQKSISDETYHELREEYIKAQPYNMRADDTLFVNYYSLKPNPTYLSKLAKQ